MKTLLIAFGVLGAIGLVLVLLVLGSYNGMVSQDQTVSNAWAQVETQYQRRFDLIPNLVNATKGVLKQEQKVFGDIATARTHYASAPAGSNEKVQATAQYEGALSRLLIVMENYPELKSIESVRGLTDEFTGTENRVLVARDRYNTSATEWNTLIKKFPRSFLANLFGFKARELFKADVGAQSAPNVNLDTQ